MCISVLTQKTGAVCVEAWVQDLLCQLVACLVTFPSSQTLHQTHHCKLTHTTFSIPGVNHARTHSDGPHNEIVNLSWLIRALKLTVHKSDWLISKFRVLLLDNQLEISSTNVIHTGLVWGLGMKLTEDHTLPTCPLKLAIHNLVYQAGLYLTHLEVSA